jgi:hypothetical protein
MLSKSKGTNFVCFLTKKVKIYEPMTVALIVLCHVHTYYKYLYCMCECAPSVGSKHSLEGLQYHRTPPPPPKTQPLFVPLIF